MRLGKHMIFLTGGECAPNPADCIKLKLFREQMQYDTSVYLAHYLIISG